ncbi:TIGR02611 family protein [Actinokineospora sp. UTMC 2448]|uniref:TIGR02611 family protein n=1 Tax=Actinokineospora sp. UTMC 2448 TaxID=2268449 RepID=UPI002164CA51|nr:TIGR02611 family protein [Actinokineospora sp. UTMC 2448]UVS78210.1 Putative transmembrane protein [Actinokineospora sp. UTMC 2448]
MTSGASEDKSIRPDWADRSKTTRLVWRVGVAVIGGAVLAGGILLIPYPGPGWLVVFAGLAILAVEFPWARRVLDFARAKYDAWVEWLKRQHIAVRLLVLAFTGVVVAVTLWLFGVFSLVGGWVGIYWPWLRSPVFD